MERVAVLQASGNVEYVARAEMGLLWVLDADGCGLEGLECSGLVHESDIDAARVGAVGDDVAVASFAQQGAPAEQSHDGVIFDFSEGYDVGGPVGPEAYDLAAEVVKLFPEFILCPSSVTFGKELAIFFSEVVSGVEEVFCVKFAYAEGTLLRLQGGPTEEQAAKQDEEQTACGFHGGKCTIIFCYGQGGAPAVFKCRT